MQLKLLIDCILHFIIYSNLILLLYFLYSGFKFAKNDSDIGSTESDNTDNTPLFYQVILIDLVFQQLQELLNDSNIGTNNLLKVSRRYLQNLKKASFHWKLNRQNSLTYCNSSEYRESISLLINTRKQLSLHLNGCSDVVDVSELGGIYSLDLIRCSNIVD